MATQIPGQLIKKSGRGRIAGPNVSLGTLLIFHTLECEELKKCVADVAKVGLSRLILDIFDWEFD